VGSPVGSPVSDLATPVGSPEAASPIAGTPAVSGASPVALAPTAAASPVSVAPAASPVSSVPVASPVAPTAAASPVSASPESVASPLGGSPVAASPVDQASPVAEATETAAATPNPTEAVQTAEAGFKQYKDVVFDTTHMSQSDYERLVVRPALARQKVEDQLLKDVGQSAPQVEASHILVDTKDLADSIYAQLQAGADFAQTAKEQSNDTATAENGGELGWFAKGQMVKQFEDVAFSLQPGQISTPFQTQYGWHIVKVTATDPDRALTDQQMTQYKDAIISRWLDGQKTDMDISSKVVPTPTPAISSFVPPPDAPPLPTATVAPDASPITGASPVPGASPIAAASPIGSPAASPAAAP
jgi:hypothetical protein